VTNLGLVIVDGSALYSANFYNLALVQSTNTANLNMIGSDYFENLGTGTYEFAGDGSISSSGGGGPFYNLGLLRKSAGATNSIISAPFNNYGGTIEVDSGQVTLAGSGSSSGGTFNVAAGAVLDLTGGGNPPYWTGLITNTGVAGGGVVEMDGTIYVVQNQPLTLDFAGTPFLWNGTFAGNGTTTNLGLVTVGGSALYGQYFYNLGLVQSTNTANLNMTGGNTYFANLAQGTYNFAGDGSISGGDPFYNWGLLRKSAGTNTSVISTAFNNNGGAIEVDSGQISLNGQSYAQGGGSFIVTLGGVNPGQFGQLLCGGATLGGPLSVKLASGYTPAVGNQFQILSSGGLSGTFTSLNVPKGISVNYSNNSVFLVVTSALPAKLVNPVLSGTNLTFSFETAINQSYTVQQNTNLATTNWIFYTNITGNGSPCQFAAPVTNKPQNYFRVSEP